MSNTNSQIQKEHSLILDYINKVNRTKGEKEYEITLKEQKPEIPDWWFKYKKENPNDNDEYSPSKHCCRRFWKDFCDCIR